MSPRQIDHLRELITRFQTLQNDCRAFSQALGHHAPTGYAECEDAADRAEEAIEALKELEGTL